MSPEEKIEAAEKLIDEARAEIAAKKRRWPEKIEPGMMFRWAKGYTYIYARGGYLVNIATGETFEGDQGFRGKQDQFTYLGHARDLIKIADDAPEPTGAELVGKVCQVSLYPISKTDDGIKRMVTSFDPIIGYRTKEGEAMPWKYARLAR